MRDKEETKRRLIKAVGEAIQLKGDKKIYNATIARLARVDRKLISRYFKNLDNLIETYVVENDYWITYAKELHRHELPDAPENLQETLISLLVNQFTYFYSNENMQRLILMEISRENWLMSSVSRTREGIGSDFLEMAENHFKATGIDIRAISALAVSGIYYSILHARVNDSTFCGIDLKTAEGRERIINALRSLITLAFDAAATEKTKETVNH